MYIYEYVYYEHAMIYLLSGAFLGALNKHKLNMRIQGVVVKNINVKEILKKTFSLSLLFWFLFY